MLNLRAVGVVACMRRLVLKNVTWRYTASSSLQIAVSISSPYH